MPRKKRQLKQDLRRVEFIEDTTRGKGRHATWLHPQSPDISVLMASHDGADVRHYDERNVREALAEVQRRPEVS